MGYLYLQCQVCFVEDKAVNQEPVSSAVKHFLWNGDYETIRMLNTRTLTNPRRALNIHALLSVGSALRYEVVYPKAAQRFVVRLSKPATRGIGQPCPEGRVFHNLVTI